MRRIVDHETQKIFRLIDFVQAPEIVDKFDIFFIDLINFFIYNLNLLFKIRCKYCVKMSADSELDINSEDLFDLELENEEVSLSL